MGLTSGFALGMGQAVSLITRFRRYVRWIEIASGVLLIVVGLLLLTDQMTLIAIWALQHGFFIDLP